MDARHSARALPSLFTISALSLCLWLGSTPPASAQRGGGGHFAFGVGGRPRGSFAFSAGASFGPRYHRGGSHVYLGLNFGVYDPWWYDPFWYGPSYYYPAYPPTVVYNVYPDDDRSYPRDRPSTARKRQADFDDYYLNRKPTPLQQDPSLRSAVTDIETAFRTGDAASLEKHVNATDTLRVQSKRSRRQVSGSEYLSMTRDALKEMRTVRFNLDHVEPGSNGAWMVYGSHVIRGDDDTEKSFHVSFVLKKSADTWFISEVSADPDK